MGPPHHPTELQILGGTTPVASRVTAIRLLNNWPSISIKPSSCGPVREWKWVCPYLKTAESQEEFFGNILSGGQSLKVGVHELLMTAVFAFHLSLNGLCNTENNPAWQLNSVPKIIEPCSCHNEVRQVYLVVNFLIMDHVVLFNATNSFVVLITLSSFLKYSNILRFRI